MGSAAVASVALSVLNAGNASVVHNVSVVSGCAAVAFINQFSHIALLAGANSLMLSRLAASSLYAVRYVLSNSAGTTNGAVALVLTPSPNSATSVLRFDASFGSVFGQAFTSTGLLNVNPD